MPRNVLVTGATGAVSAMIVRDLLARGDTPVGYDLSADLRFMPDVAGRFPLVRGDVLDWPLLLDTAERYQVAAIIHAAYLLPDQAQANPWQAVQVNVVGTTNVVEVAARLGLRLVFCSTKGVYQDFVGEYGHPTYRPITEDYPIIPPDNNHTLYNDTKVFCEHYLNKYRAIRHNLDFVILRFATMYGPGRVRHGNRVIAGQMVEAAAAGQPYRLAEGGDQQSDLLYLRDVAHACVLAAEATLTDQRTFNIGSGRLITMRDFAAAIRAVIPTADLEIGPGLDPFKLGFISFGVFDIGPARAALGYEPLYPLETAIRDYVDMLRLIEPARAAAVVD